MAKKLESSAHKLELIGIPDIIDFETYVDQYDPEYVKGNLFSLSTSYPIKNRKRTSYPTEEEASMAKERLDGLFERGRYEFRRGGAYGHVLELWVDFEETGKYTDFEI